MKCPYCNDFHPNNKVRGYPVREQLTRHLTVKHGLAELCRPVVKQLIPIKRQS
jgi:hypothetical protein